MQLIALLGAEILQELIAIHIHRADTPQVACLLPFPKHLDDGGCQFGRTVNHWLALRAVFSLHA